MNATRILVAGFLLAALPMLPAQAAAAEPLVPPQFGMELLPGSDVDRGRAMREASIVLVVRAQDDLKITKRLASHTSTVMGDIRGGGNVTYAYGKQTFDVLEVLRGQAKTGTQEVAYGFCEESRAFPGPKSEQAVRKGETVLLFQGDKDVLLKVLPDTPENRKAVTQTAASPRAMPLGNTKPATDVEIDQAIKQLAGADREVRHKAAERLGEAGPAASRTIPALIAALNEEARRPKAEAEMGATTEEDYGGCLVRVLAGFGKTAVPLLIEILKKDADVRPYVLGVLERIGADAEAAVPVVVSLGKEADHETRASAIGTLGKIGRRSPQAISAMIVALGDGFQPVRAKAVRALGECGPAAKEAVPALVRAWKEEKNDSVRQGILDALGLIGPNAKDAVPMLTEALHHNEPIIRWCAARALGRIGPAAGAAAEALKEAAADKVDYVRKQAAEALKRISRTRE